MDESKIQINSEFRQEVRAFMIGKNKKFIVVNAKSYATSVFSPPKGGLKQGESLLDGLRRELIEELGILDLEILKASEVVQQIIYPSEIQEKSKQKGSMIYSFWVKANNNIVINADELNDVKYLNHEDFKVFMQKKLNKVEFDLFSKEFKEVRNLI